VPQSEWATRSRPGGAGYVARGDYGPGSDRPVHRPAAPPSSGAGGLTAEEKRRRLRPRSAQPGADRERPAEAGQAQDALFGTQRQLALSTVSATLLERGHAPAAAGGLTAAWQSFLRAATTVACPVWVGYGLGVPFW